MIEMILSAVISFFVDTIGNFLFAKSLNNTINEKDALDSKITYINKINNISDHNQNSQSKQNIIDNNVIGNNNNTLNYNQNIQVTNNMNMTINHANNSSHETDPLLTIICLFSITIVMSCGFFWLKRSISHYTLICFLVFLIGLIINKIFSYVTIRKYNYLFLEKDKYILFSVILFLIMILIQSDIFVPQKFLQMEKTLNNELNFKILCNQLISSFNFAFYYVLKNILQLFFMLIPLIDVIFAILKKKIPLLITMNVNGFIYCFTCFLFAYYIPILILYFN